MPGCARPSKPNCFTGGPKCGGGKACCLDHDCTHKCVDPALPDGKLANKYFCSLNIVTLLTTGCCFLKDVERCNFVRGFKTFGVLIH